MITRTELRRRFVELLPLAVYGAAVAGFATYSPYILYDFPLDDAWIERVYSRAFAFGHGFAYNDGVQEAGVTTPLWVVVTAPAQWLSALGGASAVVVGVKAIGVLLGAAAVLALRDIARQLTGLRGAACIAASVFAVDPRLLFSVLSGMEVTLLVALWLGAARAALARRYLAAVVMLGLAPLARPEALVILPPALLGIAASAGLRHGFWRRPGPWLILMLPTAAWCALCRLLNDHWLPNTFYVKAQPFALGLERMRTAWEAVSQHGWGSHPLLLGGLVVFGGWLILWPNRDRWIAAALLLVAPLGYLGGVVGSRDFHLGGYYWTRWTDPASLLLTAAFAVGLALSLMARLDLDRLGEVARRVVSPGWRVTLTALWILGIGGLLLALPRLGESYLERRERLASDSRAIRKINVEPGLWVRDHTPPDAVIGVNDAGALRYFGERRTIDLLGLNNADIAFDRVRPRAIFEQLDWLAVFPSWFSNSRLLSQFERRQIFQIPLVEYTVCRCPSQTVQLIAERRSRRR